MIVFTNPSPYIPYGDNNVVIYNFSSYKEGFQRLVYLNPILQYNLFQFDSNIIYSDEFDKWYFDYIFSNQNVYVEFIGCIMRNVYMGKDVYILIDPNFQMANIIIESLIRLIRLRYGYICNITYDFELDKESLIDSDFSIEGVVLIDDEMEKFSRNYLSNEVIRFAQEDD